MIFLIFISISAVSASENATDVVAYDDEGCDDLGDSYNTQAFITAKDYSSYYGSDKKVAVQVKDENGKAVKHVSVAMSCDSGSYSSKNTNSEGKAYFNVYGDVGNHRANIFLEDLSYDSDTVQIKVKITKAPVKLTVSKVTSKTNKYATLKATVKDSSGSKVKQGTVKFKINGKTYKVKVKNGIATKKVKLTKAKTYNYKAVFSAKNYKSKTASSKVIVKKSSSGHYYKKGGYKFKVSNSQYKKIKYVKNHKHSKHLSTYADFKIKTNYYYGGLPVYAIVTTWSGIRGGQYYNYPQVQFVVMYGPNTWDWDYLTDHYQL